MDLAASFGEAPRRLIEEALGAPERRVRPPDEGDAASAVLSHETPARPAKHAEYCSFR
jgi:hypothetical protein